MRDCIRTYYPYPTSTFPSLQDNLVQLRSRLPIYLDPWLERHSRLYYVHITESFTGKSGRLVRPPFSDHPANENYALRFRGICLALPSISLPLLDNRIEYNGGDGLSVLIFIRWDPRRGSQRLQSAPTGPRIALQRVRHPGFEWIQCCPPCWTDWWTRRPVARWSLHPTAVRWPASAWMPWAFIRRTFARPTPRVHLRVPHPPGKIWFTFFFNFLIV